MQHRHSRVEIISVHVPKTAGTMFRNALIQIYDKERVFTDYKHKNIDELLLEINQQDIKAIHGHFQVEKYDNHFAEAKRVIWLREPLNRLISHYWHQITWVRKRKMALKLADLDLQLNKEGLLNYASQPKICNLMSRHFKKRDIDDFWFVGITEFFKDDLIVLQKMLKWPEVKVGAINKHKYAQKYRAFVNQILADEELIEQLKGLNRKDIEIYQRALNLRKRRISPSQFQPKIIGSIEYAKVLETSPKEPKEQLGKQRIERVYIRGCPRSGNTLMLYLCGAGFENTHLLEKEQIPTKEKSIPGRITFGKYPSPERTEKTTIWADNFLDEPDGAVVFTIRDPRDVLVSEHGRKPGEPWVTNPDRWIENAILLKDLEHHPRVVAVKFEELLTKPNEIQERIAKALGLKISIPFSECWKHFEDPKKNNLALKGIRPLEVSRIGNWRTDSNKNKYIEQKLNESADILPLMEYFGYVDEAKTTVSDLKNIPGFCQGAIEFLDDFLRQKSDAKVLEFGSGSSTIWISKLARKLVSIEHNVRWYERIKNYLEQEKIEDLVDLRLLPKPYDRVCQEFPDESFDLVIVDGSDRLKCLEASIRVLKPGGVLMLDDAQRKPYKKARKLLKNWQVTQAIQGDKETHWWQKPLPAKLTISSPTIISSATSASISNRPYVLAIGLNKCGTTSLDRAFKELGWHALHGPYKFNDAIWKAMKEGEKLLHFLPKFNMFSDIFYPFRGDEHPCMEPENRRQFLEMLDRQYPGSKFICNIRNKGDWLESRKHHVIRNQRNKDYKWKWLKIEKEAWKQEYDIHYQIVFEYFQNRQDFLVMDFDETQTYESLCKFLQMPVLDKEFPRIATSKKTNK